MADSESWERKAAVEAFLIRQISRSRLLDSWLTELDSGVRSRETYRQRRTCAFASGLLLRGTPSYSAVTKPPPQNLQKQP